MAQALVADTAETEMTGVRDDTAFQIVPPLVDTSSVDAVQAPGPAPQFAPLCSDTHATSLPTRDTAIRDANTRSTTCHVLPPSSVRSISPPGQALPELVHGGAAMRSPRCASQNAEPTRWRAKEIGAAGVEVGDGDVVEVRGGDVVAIALAWVIADEQPARQKVASVATTPSLSR
jgi:hypothetical protein